MCPCLPSCLVNRDTYIGVIVWFHYVHLLSWFIQDIFFSKPYLWITYSNWYMPRDISDVTRYIWCHGIYLMSRYISCRELYNLFASIQSSIRYSLTSIKYCLSEELRALLGSDALIYPRLMTTVRSASFGCHPNKSSVGVKLMWNNW